MDDQLHNTSELSSLAIGVGGVATAVVAISLLSPDMVSGSEQQHLPVAAFGAWMWGVVSVGAVVAYCARRRPLHRAFALAVTAIWTVATAVALFSPVMVTGSDPTRLPLGAILAPVGAAVLTVLTWLAFELVPHKGHQARRARPARPAEMALSAG